MPIDLIDTLQLAPPFHFSELDDTPLPLPTDDFVTALQQFLIDIPGVGDAVDKRVIWDAPLPGTEIPYAVFSLIHERTNVVTNKIFFDEAEYQFDFFAMDDRQCKAIAKAAYIALLPDEDMEEILFREGREMTRIPRLFYGPKVEPQGLIGAERVWRCHFDYGWLIGPQR